MASSAKPDITDLLECVSDKTSFVAFLKALSAEADLADQLCAADPERYRYTSVIGWENGTIGTFLDASAAWLEDQAPEFRIKSDADGVTWKEMAEIFYAGKIYE